MASRHSVRSIVIALALACSEAATATPYASSVRNTTGATWEFVLNESASNVTVLRDGGNAVNLGALAPGRHTFDMNTFTTWQIKVSQNTAVAPYTLIGDPNTNPYTAFERPDGVTVNTNPLSPYFGVLYVANERNVATVGTGSLPSRSMAPGVYSLTADLLGVDLSTPAWTVPNSNDTSQAKGGAFWTADPVQINQPWRMTIDEGGNLMVTDWSDAYGGIKYLTPDMTNGGLILAVESGPTGGVLGVNNLPVHGSITSKPYVTGKLGTNLKVWAMDEDLEKSRNPNPVLNANGDHIWKWDVDAATLYNVEPSLVVNTSAIQLTTDNRPNFISSNGGSFVCNAHYSPAFNKWYLTEYRFDGNEAGLIVVTPDGVNGNTPTLNWSSLQFSIDKGLDGNSGLGAPAGCLSASCMIQDAFRGMGGGLSISPDGKNLIIQQVDTRSSLRSSNPFFGTTAGEVIVIPLDANGTPDIKVSGGLMTNVSTISTQGGNVNTTRREVAIDAAGNIYVGNSNSERVKVYSPGGSTFATTNSNGTFTVAIAGDYNNNGFVDAADYALWRNGGPLQNENATVGSISQEDYDVWRQNFGKSGWTITGTPPGSGASDLAGTVPEPNAFVLFAMGLAALAARRKRPST